jgi:hypothetical protein
MQIERNPYNSSQLIWKTKKEKKKFDNGTIDVLTFRIPKKDGEKEDKHRYFQCLET